MKPLDGNGITNYIVVMRDAVNECAVQTLIEAVFCDNGACMEFEGVEGVFSPAFGYDSGSTITTENSISLTYERNPVTDCACNLFVTDGLPGVNFGSGHIVATQNSGFGLHFGNAVPIFNTVNVDYYYTGGGITVQVNEETPITVASILDLPATIGGGVSLQVTPDANGVTGMLTFSGDNIGHLYLYTNESAAFDNVCVSFDDNVLSVIPTPTTLPTTLTSSISVLRTAGTGQPEFPSTLNGQG
ncbi:MAG: hypothetical protein R2795_07815 [Saprospiraceae bacterium]